MGDFNYPDIDWSISYGGSVNSQRFVDCVDEGFLTQHVDGTCNGAILDLVITNEPEMIDCVTVLVYWTRLVAATIIYYSGKLSCGQLHQFSTVRD